MNNRTTLVAVLVVVTLGAGACVSKPSLTETHFGDSVRQMIRAQTANPSTLETPSTAPVEGGDGQRTENVLDAYRTDVAKPQSVNKDVVINVDSGRR